MVVAVEVLVAMVAEVVVLSEAVVVVVEVVVEVVVLREAVDCLFRFSVSRCVS